MAKLFEYAVIYQGKKDKQTGDWIEKPMILVPPVTVLAETDREAGLVAAKAIPDGYNDKLDRVEVAVRPF